MYLFVQTLQEPEGDGKVLDAEFGGHRVLAVLKPPTRGTVSGPSLILTNR